MKINTCNLSGAALDWAVAKCEITGDKETHPLPDCPINELTGKYSPSTNWAQGGPIIVREGISILNLEAYSWDVEGWTASKGELWSPTDDGRVSETPLVAAMREYVSRKLGDEVEVPDSLLENPKAETQSVQSPAKKSIRKEYMGCACPACQSDSIVTVSEVNLDANTAWHTVQCNNCDFEWDDVYTLTGIDVPSSSLAGIVKQLNEVGVSVYESEYGFGFTDCEADIYESELDAALAAFMHCVDLGKIITRQTREVDVDDDMPGEYVPVKSDSQPN